MSDIVEWLRKHAVMVAMNDIADGLRVDEAADEIERLRRAGFGGLSYDIAEKQRQEIARQDAEIERLRAERDALLPWGKATTDIVDELRNGAGYLCCTKAADEIERLRGHIDRDVAEIERLREHKKRAARR